MKKRMDDITDGLFQQTKKWILKMAQYGELSHFIFNSKTELCVSSNHSEHNAQDKYKDDGTEEGW